MTRLAVRDAFTVAIEVSLHNTTLAILIGGTLLQNQEMVKPALIYSIFSFWTALIFGFLTRRIFRDKLEPG
jgi:BASS family bile acid:Na+ symporter